MTTTHKLQNIISEPKKDKTPIELIRFWSKKGTNNIEDTTCNPREWEEVILLHVRYFGNGDDLILCRNDSGTCFVYRGRWNDGIVEE